MQHAKGRLGRVADSIELAFADVAAPAAQMALFLTTW